VTHWLVQIRLGAQTLHAILAGDISEASETTFGLLFEHLLEQMFSDSGHGDGSFNSAPWAFLLIYKE
jgi:hypothetical protein